MASDEIVGEGKLRIDNLFVCFKYFKFRDSNEDGNYEKVVYAAKDFAALKNYQ